MSDLSLEDQNTAERQTELIATGPSDPNSLGREFTGGVVLQVKPGEGTVGDFDGINGIASGTGNGVRGDAHSTGSGVLGTSDAAKGFAFGVSGSAVSPDGAGVSGRNDFGTAVTGFST